MSSASRPAGPSVAIVAPSERASAAAWSVTVHRSWEAAASLWQPLFDLDQGSPFQSERWLSAWYAGFAARNDIEPLLVHVADAGGRAALALPLILRKGRVRSIEFADLGITDYNAPLLGPGAPIDRASAAALWAEIRKALPPADRIVLEKMLVVIGDRPNPLALALDAKPSSLAGSYLPVHTDWESWLRAQDKHLRKELGRFWRVFTRDERASFEIVTGPDLALSVYRRLEIQQGARIRELGLDYRLDDPLLSALYRELLLAGLADGTVILSALTAGDELVASLYGIASGDHIAFVRISVDTEKWATCSPGRLIIERTMEALSRQGYHIFDFAIGDYSYKRSFGPTERSLVEASVALTWRAWPSAIRESGEVFVKSHPAIARAVRKLLRRPLN